MSLSQAGVGGCNNLQQSVFLHTTALCRFPALFRSTPHIPLKSCHHASPDSRHSLCAKAPEHREEQHRSITCRSLATPAASASALEQPGTYRDQISVIMKFGGSSLASAERIREVAEIICSFPEHYPCIVLSAMGKTTNLLLQAGQEALRVAPGAVPSLAPLRTIRELHRRTAADLGMGSREDMESLLSEMQQLLVGISIMQELTARAQDSLVSFGERLSTRLFASYLRSQGVATRQHDAFSIGMTTTDDFQNADVLYGETLPALKAALARPPGAPRAIPVITGFLGRGINTGAITTLGRGGSDLTATVLGAALGVDEVQVWKDVDGVLTSDPRIVKEARPVPLLTFDEATELAFFGATVLHPSAMQPAMQVSSLDVRVKNSYNRKAAGTLISRNRDMSDVLMTSIVLKTDVTLMDIVSTRMLGQFGFLAKVFDVFRDNQISVDVVATSEISVSLTLDQSKIWERDLIDEEIQSLMSAFGDFAKVSCTHNVSIISLICNVAKTSSILERVFRVLGKENVNVKMMSQGASKTNISLIVADAEGRTVVQALHSEFF